MTSETDEQFLDSMVQWRPIMEAPRELEDGRDVLLLTMDGPLIAFWEKGRWLDKDGQLVSFITHWMPLPSPPAGEERT
jgi:hypothetical protein